MQPGQTLNSMHRLARLAMLIATLGTTAARADVLREPQWRAWFDAGKLGEVERASLARLSQRPGDPQAVAALSLTAAELAEPHRLQRALEAANACIATQPSAALCHNARGQILGLQALQGGGLTALRLAGDVRAAHARALELDPMFYEARQALVQFYLAVPAIAGGSVEKARELALAAQTRQPEQAKLLRAMVALKEERLAEVERELAAIRPGDDASLRDDVRKLRAQLANTHFRAGQLGQAKAVYEALAREVPGHALPLYGLARVASGEGQLDEAIGLLERARMLHGAALLPIDHRLGQALLSKGEKAKARQVLERFIASAKERWVNPRNIDDARKLLASIVG